MGALEDRLELTATERTALGSLVDGIKSVADFFGDALEAFEDVDLGWWDAIAKATPWAAAAAEGTAEAIPPLRFVLKVGKELLEEKDPAALAWLACSVAYQGAVEQSLAELRPVLDRRPGAELIASVERALGAIRQVDGFDLDTLDLSRLAAHGFVEEADGFLCAFAEGIGLDATSIRRLKHGVHRRLRTNLLQIVSHRGSLEKFEAVRERLKLGAPTEEAAARRLGAHHAYLRRLFRSEPVLSRDPFALCHVYTGTDCIVNTWQAVKQARSSPATAEKSAPEDRRPLLGVVDEYLGDPRFRDAIVIEGPAGAGKSSFTLQLCDHLIARGLLPIRLRLGELRMDVPLLQALAIGLETHRRGETGPHLPSVDELPRTWFDDEVCDYGEARICPYVVVLDGWDEISLAASEGFRQVLERFLTKTRTDLIDRRSKGSIRVVITGRPSPDLYDARFLKNATPLLQVAPLAPTQVEAFVAGILRASGERPLGGGDALNHLDLARYGDVFDRYRKAYEEGLSELDILGLPLLAHSAIRVMDTWPEDRFPELLASRTTLLRALTTLASHNAGKAGPELQEGHTVHIAGERLRGLLRLTAVAITAHGAEMIPYDELKLRLEHLGCADVDAEVEAARDLLYAVVVSFFFKGGHPEAGCEFLHKSFREYLLAESIVDRVKRLAREHDGMLAGTGARAASRDERSWQDYPPGRSQHHASRDLGWQLAPHFLTAEVIRHIGSLIAWEVERSFADPPGEDALTPAQWELARDRLADLWEWWAEGVHLRPQPHRKGRQISFDEPFVLELVRWCAPQDLPELAKVGALPRPVRTTSCDAHLGDGLLRLTAWVHYQVAVAQGWLESADRPAGRWSYRDDDSGLLHQVVVGREERRWTLFRPAGASRQYLDHLAGRITAAGWGPHAGYDLSGAFLEHARLPGMWVEVMRHAYAVNAELQLDVSCDATGVYGRSLSLRGMFMDARFAGADLRNATLRDVLMGDCDFKNAILTDADLGAAHLIMVDLSGAIGLTSAQLGVADRIADCTLPVGVEVPE